jgi:hypothetical protein
VPVSTPHVVDEGPAMVSGLYSSVFAGVWFSVDVLLLAVYTGDDVAAVRAKGGFRATKLVDHIA